MANYDIVFEDNSVKIIAAIEDAVDAFLLEAGAELESQVIRNSRADTGQTRSKWAAKLDKGNKQIFVGNPLENAVWEEFGTGEYAVNGDGGTPYWVFVAGSGKKKGSGGHKVYTLKEAKRVVAILRKKGLEAYYTKGKRGTRAFEKAKTTVKPKINKMAKEAFKNV